MEGTFPQFNNVSGYFNIDQGLTVGMPPPLEEISQLMVEHSSMIKSSRQFGTGNSKSRSETSHL